MTSEPEAKRVKLHVPSDLKLEKVLMNDVDTKSTFVLATNKETGDKAVVVLNKKPFTEAEINQILESQETSSTEVHRNDKFSKFDVKPPPGASEVGLTQICPASEWDIQKYSHQERYLVRETAAVYNAVTRPFIESLPTSRVAWVHNILDHKAEVDKILFENDDFIFLPDTKWDVKDPTAAYCQAIVKRRDLRSVRDLRGDHLAMLKGIAAEGKRTLKEKFGVDPNQVRVFFHYLPSFWHLHVHFAALSCPALGGSFAVAKALLLDDVVDALEASPGHFEGAALSFVVGGQEPLCKALRTAGVLPPA